MIPASIIHAAKKTALSAGNESRPEELGHGGEFPLRIGQVLAVEDNGTYEVGLLDESAAIAAIFQGCRVVPEGDYEIGDVVWLVFFPGIRNPVIFNSGAGVGDLLEWLNQFGMVYGS